MSNEIINADDEGLANIVGPWSEEKHQRLRHYVGIASGPRKRFLGAGKAGASYIDPYCAMGRAFIRNQNRFVDGSSVTAWRESVIKKAPFTEVHIGDISSQAIEENSRRLHRLGAPVHTYNGPAVDTISEICRNLNPYGLHFAFLDPYNLAALPFKIIQKLCAFQRMDLLIHVSSQDLQRNFGRYLSDDKDVLDHFAPGWRNVIDRNDPEHLQRTKVFQHWLKLISNTGKNPSSNIEHVKGSRNQTLYWLVLVSSHTLAHQFWDKIRCVGGQVELF